VSFRSSAGATAVSALTLAQPIHTLARVLTIRTAQMVSLEASTQKAHMEAVVRFLRAQLADECRGDDDDALVARVRRGRAAASRHGITAGWDVARFVACQICLGDAFVTDPAHAWASAILARADLTPAAKMDLIDLHYLTPFRRRRAGAPT